VALTVPAVDTGKIRLMGMAEIAERLRLSRERASQLANRRDFPEPVARLKMGQVWLADDVDAWVRQYRPHLDEPEDQA
jgi:prophage regulatory protein